ncbi:ABC transporter substrate-binding protein [Mesorhizobium sp. M0189]|uniref:ABC transporter substrate-binding protein n=1 Tax=Mesorhizobium sp. M0189 TaxID=2956909 RepID=UPI00333730B0
MISFNCHRPIFSQQLKTILNLALEVLGPSGQDFYWRMNCLQKPFNNVKACQALLHLVDQEAFMRVVVGNPDYFKTITSWFGNNTPYTNDENTGWFKKGGDPEKAKQFQESGYSGETVVILQPTDWGQGRDASQFLAAELRKIGVNAELAASDWGGVAARREKRFPSKKAAGASSARPTPIQCAASPMPTSVCPPMANRVGTAGQNLTNMRLFEPNGRMSTRSSSGKNSLARCRKCTGTMLARCLWASVAANRAAKVAHRAD